MLGHFCYFGPINAEGYSVVSTEVLYKNYRASVTFVNISFAKAKLEYKVLSHNAVSKCEFRENRCSERNSLPKEVNKILRVFSTLSSDLEIRYRCPKKLLSKLDIRKKSGQ